MSAYPDLKITVEDAVTEGDKIVEAWNEFDFMKMYSQVGALSLNLQ